METPIPTPERRRRSINRLTVVESVYHQSDLQQPTARPVRFTRVLETDEQQFCRVFTVGEEWVPLPAGWIERCGMLHLVNEEGSDRATPNMPFPPEVAARVLEVSTTDPPTAAWMVPPGESFRGQPATLEELKVRCRKGRARCTITLYPS